MSKILSKKRAAVARYLGQLEMERMQLPQAQPCTGQCTPTRTTITGLPDSANGTPLDGDVYVGGQCCRTVGEYKAAVEATAWKDAYR